MTERPNSGAEMRVMVEAMMLLRRYGYRVIPGEVYDDAHKVVQYVSAGRGYIGVEPYPDALARKVNGFMTDEDGPGCPDATPENTDVCMYHPDGECGPESTDPEVTS